jgi:hypothetical protein
MRIKRAPILAWQKLAGLPHRAERPIENVLHGGDAFHVRAGAKARIGRLRSMQSGSTAAISTPQERGCNPRSLERFQPPRMASSFRQQPPKQSSRVPPQESDDSCPTQPSWPFVQEWIGPRCVGSKSKLPLDLYCPGFDFEDSEGFVSRVVTGPAAVSYPLQMPTWVGNSDRFPREGGRGEPAERESHSDEQFGYGPVHFTI